jgi:hypothetical protein
MGYSSFLWLCVSAHCTGTVISFASIHAILTDSKTQAQSSHEGGSFCMGRPVSFIGSTRTTAGLTLEVGGQKVNKPPVYARHGRQCSLGFSGRQGGTG